MAHNDRWNADDIIAADLEAKRYPIIDATIGTILTHRSSGTRGRVVGFTPGQRLVLEDPTGTRHDFTPHEGAFTHRGTAVALRAATTSPSSPLHFTASGSIDAGPSRARVARASRLWVEGVHDAELVERIWGEDLRVEGVVVEPLHGADTLADRVEAFRPSARSRLGVLLDHLIDGSKESRIAAAVSGPHVMVAGHPYVDIWQAIRPSALGIPAWPDVPRDVPWKDGVIAALGHDVEAGAFWQSALERVSSYRDVETPLMTAVESLIDFVTAPGSA
jgi:hypothetical protein